MKILSPVLLLIGLSSGKHHHHRRGVENLLLRNRDTDHGVVGTDDIAMASNDDMFAFSQIISTGGSIKETVSAIESEAKEEKQAKIIKDKTTWEVAAKAKAALKSGKVKTLSKKEKQEHEKALNELRWLQTNEATSAFADLQEA